MGFRTKIGWLILNLIILVFAMVVAIMECVVVIIAFFPALMIDHYPKWGKFPLTEYLDRGVARHSLFDKPPLIDGWKEI